MSLGNSVFDQTKIWVLGNYLLKTLIGILCEIHISFIYIKLGMEQIFKYSIFLFELCEALFHNLHCISSKRNLVEN